MATDAVKFTRELLGDFARRLVTDTIRVGVHPQGLSGENLGDVTGDPAFQPGAVIPLMAIVTVASQVESLYLLIKPDYSLCN